MDRSGSVSQGALLTVMVEAAAVLLRQYRFQDIIPEAVSIYFLHLVPLEQALEVRATLIDIGRQVGKVEMVILCDEKVVCKAMLTVQSLNQ
jgi:predicted transcriptional regulator